MTQAEIFGDPEAMRALARELAGRAEMVSTIPVGATSSLDVATFEGGAAVRLRGRTSAARASVTAIAADLRDLATAVLVDASSVERQNAAAKAAADAADADAAAGAGERS